MDGRQKKIVTTTSATMPKDWDRIARALSSPESSDAEDELNVISVQRNAHRVAQLVHGYVPSLDPSRAGVPPLGMNAHPSAGAVTRSAAFRRAEKELPRAPTPPSGAPAAADGAGAGCRRTAPAAAPPEAPAGEAVAAAGEAVAAADASP